MFKGPTLVSEINEKEATRFRNIIQYYKLQRKNIYIDW